MADVRLPEVHLFARRLFTSMEKYLSDLDTVEIDLEEGTLEALDQRAFSEHRGNRDAVIRELLDEWLKSRDDS